MYTKVKKFIETMSQKMCIFLHGDQRHDVRETVQWFLLLKNTGLQAVSKTQIIISALAYILLPV